MAMFDDPKKELQRLEEQLLQEEDWFAKELESAKKMIGDAPVQKKKPSAPRQSTQVRNYANDYGNEPAPQARNPEKGSAKKKAPKEKGIKGLVILAVLETLGIVAVVAYWLLYLL